MLLDTVAALEVEVKELQEKFGGEENMGHDEAINLESKEEEADEEHIESSRPQEEKANSKPYQGN